MIGITREEVNELNAINIQEYLLETDKDNFIKRNNGTIIYKKDKSYVIWSDHAYVFGKVVQHPYKDPIGLLRELYGYSFMEAVNKLREYVSKVENKEYQKLIIAEKPEIPQYNMFD